MSEYSNSFDDLRGDLFGVLESFRDLSTSQQKLDTAMAAEIDKLWHVTAELRDDLHALANRIEAATHGR